MILIFPRFTICPSLGLLLITACTCRQFQAYFTPNWLLIPPLCMSPSRAQAGSDCRKGHDETSYVGVWADLGCRDRAAQRGALVWWQVILKTSWKQEPEGPFSYFDIFYFKNMKWTACSSKLNLKEFLKFELFFLKKYMNINSNPREGYMIVQLYITTLKY